MKSKFTMLLAIALLASSAASAQMQQMSVEEMVTMAMEKLQPLQLNADQQQKTQPVFTDYYKNVQKIMKDARDSGQRPDRSVFEKARNDRDESLKKIFTGDQFKKFKDEVEETLRGRRKTNP